MKRRTAILLLAISVMVGSISGAVITTLRSDSIAAGVSVAGVDVSGLTMREARQRLSPIVKQIRARPITLSADGREWRVGLRDLGMSPDLDATIEKARAIGRGGNWAGRFIARWFRGGSGKNLDISIAFDLSRLDRGLSDIARSVERKHKDAKLRFAGGRITVEPEQPGVKVDVGRCARDISALSWRDEPIELGLVEDKPDVTAADLRRIDGPLSSYTTRFPAWRANRTHNIHLAVRTLDGAVVKPGEVFSFNETVGPRLKKLGYLDAPVFRNGELEPGTGGGVCQLSSTAYNAALLADLRILRRSHHSGSVPYVPLGRDATVAYGLVDLKFRNTTAAPVYIAAGIKGNRLTVTIYGSSAFKREVVITGVGARRVPHGTITYQDPSLPPGARVVKRSGHSGFSISTYRTVKENGVAIRRERISHDVYRPLHTKVAVGPRIDR
ncbi:MAG: VanW family protein [Armatimonadota bacterium]|nr:VanW family protein [Armatimonadota bacterium]